MRIIFQVLLKCFKCMRHEDGSESELSSNQLPPSKLNHVTAVERYVPTWIDVRCFKSP